MASQGARHPLADHRCASKQYEPAAVDGEWVEKIVRGTRRPPAVRCSPRFCPRACRSTVIDKPLKKKEISKLIDESFRRCGLQGDCRLRRQADAERLRAGDAGRHLLLLRRHARSGARSTRSSRPPEAEVKEIETQYTNGLVTQGERYNKVVDIWGRTGDQVAKVDDGRTRPRGSHRSPRQEGQAGFLQLDLHDGRLRRPRLCRADPPAGRHARPDGEAGRLDHRDADHHELPRRPERSPVLHLDARRAQGPGRHRAEDGELRLPDASSGGRDAGPGHHRGRLRHRATASR